MIFECKKIGGLESRNLDLCVFNFDTMKLIFPPYCQKPLCHNGFETKKKNESCNAFGIITFVLLCGRDGRIRLLPRTARLRSFAALDVHRTSIHYRSYFKSCSINLSRKTKTAPQGRRFVFWQGWQDSNLRMQQSKCCVLPLDDIPI